MRIGKLVSLVPPRGPARALTAVALVDSIGTGFLIAGSAVVFVRGLGLTATEVGVGMAVANLIGLILTVPLGMVSDRVDARTMLAVLHVWRAACTAALPFVSGLPGFLLVFTLTTIADCGVVPVTRSVVSGLMGPESRTVTLGYMRAWRNVGFAAGAALTAPLLALDTRRAYVVILVVMAVAYALAAAAVRWFLPPLGSRAGARASRPQLRLPAVVRDRPFVALTVLDAVLMTHVTVLTLGLPLWITERTAASPVLISVLVAINTVLAVALQVRFASAGESTSAGRRSLVAAGIAMGVCCLLIAGTASAPGWAVVVLLVLSVVALTGAELWEAAGSWGLSYRFSSSTHEGEYMSFFSLAATAQAIAGPLVVAWIVSDGGATRWIVFGLLLAVAGMLAAPLTAWLERAGAGRDDDMTAEVTETAPSPG